MGNAVGYYWCLNDPRESWSDFERKLGFEFLDELDDKYSMNIGKEVWVYTGSANMGGVYRGTLGKRVAILLPRLVIERFPVKDGEISRAIWDCEDTETIESGVIQGMSVRRDGFFEEYVRRYNEVEASKRQGMSEDFSI
jgi:hypothetical protein